MTPFDSAMADTDASRVEGARSRTITWANPARTRFRLRGLLGLSLDEFERGRTGFSVVADELHENRAITQTTERVHAEDRVVPGGRVATTEARADDAGTLYAHAKSTCLVQGGAR
jgi:hypothetical protein